MVLAFRCPTCNKVLATAEGNNVSICGNVTIVSDFPPPNMMAPWVKCTNHGVFLVPEGGEELRLRQKIAAAKEQLRLQRQLNAANERRQKERDARRQAEIQANNEKRIRLKQVLDGKITSLRQKQKANDDMLLVQREKEQAAAKVHLDRLQEHGALQAKVNSEEARLAMFQVIHVNPDRPLVFMAGRTGAGKSTLVCRWSTDKAVRDHPKAEGGKAPRGHGMGSCTHDFSLYECVVGDRSVYVLDPPGHNDTGGTQVDASTGNSFAAQIKGCGGYNAILLVTTMRDKATPEFCSMLQFYRDLFGTEMYKRMAVVVTGVDAPDNKDDYDKYNCQTQIETTLHTLTGYKIPVIPIGYRNFEAARQRLRDFIPSTKHEPQNIKSPLDKLKEDAKAKQTEVNEAYAKLKLVRQCVENIRVQQKDIKTKLHELCSSRD